MIIVDKITLTTFFIILKILIKNKFEKLEIRIIENKNSKLLFYIFCFLTKKLDINTKILKFYAGHCYTKKKENIWTKARHTNGRNLIRDSKKEIRKKLDI